MSISRMLPGGQLFPFLMSMSHNLTTVPTKNNTGVVAVLDLG